MFTGIKKILYSSSRPKIINLTYRKDQFDKDESYSSYEKYLDYEMLLITKQSRDDLYINVGDYEFPFQVQLPPFLPSR